MSVATFQPQVSVLLKKNIGRSTLGGTIAPSERFRGAGGAKRTIDLTPYLGEEGGVVVTKSIREASGRWSVTLTDSPAPGQLESVYGLVEPLDVIEIRMARDVSLYYGKYPEHMPVMMRGFVSSVRRSHVMGSDGRPQRVVTISGQDYGKLLEMIQVIYLPGAVVGQYLLSAYKLFLNYGVEAKADQDAADFIGSVLTDVILPFLANMRLAAGGPAGVEPPVMDMKAAVTRGSGTVSPFGTQEYQGGSLWQLMTYFGDVGAWNELFVEDRDDAPYLVYRPTPFKRLDGSMIQDGVDDPGVVTVTDDDLVSIDQGRSDSNVSNYYWVDAPRYNLTDGSVLKAGIAGALPGPDPLLTGYQNSSPELYGVRVMQTQTQQGPRIDGQSVSQQDSQLPGALQLIGERRRILIEANKDNVVLEDGDMVLRGNEAVKPGRYLKLTRGAAAADAAKGKGVASTSYVVSVTHSYTAFREFRTTVHFERGTGFVQRAQQGTGANSPYLTDLNLGGAYA